MNASSITELDEEQRQDAYKKYQLIELFLNLYQNLKLEFKNDN